MKTKLKEFSFEFALFCIAYSRSRTYAIAARFSGFLCFANKSFLKFHCIT